MFQWKILPGPAKTILLTSLLYLFHQFAAYTVKTLLHIKYRHGEVWFISLNIDDSTPLNELVWNRFRIAKCHLMLVAGTDNQNKTNYVTLNTQTHATKSLSLVISTDIAMTARRTTVSHHNQRPGSHCRPDWPGKPLKHVHGADDI